MKLIEKLLCAHGWEIMRVVNYSDHDNVLMVCRKCGRIARKRV